MSEVQDHGDDVQEFAALLRRLKERTDRSYGSLARRLNMNTSTLHRYCAGDAVPVDFAPVERFAALCGASAAERMELHRLWLSAVAARQRPRTAEPTEPSGPSGPSGPSEPSRASESSEALVVSARAEGDPRAEAAGGPGPESGEEGEGDSERAGEPDTVHVTASAAPPPLPWYRRRRFLVTAAAVVVALATLGSLSALPSGRPASDKVAQAPDPSSRTTASSLPGRSGSPSPSPDATSASPSTGATRTGPSASASPGRGTSKKNTGAGKQGTSVGTPLTWSANSQIWEGGCGHDYVIDKPPSQVPPPPLVQDAGTWAATQGAIHGRETKVQISVQGRSSTAVVLEALRVRITGRSSPAPGIAYAMDQGCGGGLTPRGFDVNLDIDRPIAHAVAGNDSGQTVPAVEFPYRVSATDPEVLLVTATTQTYDCNWYLELDWSSQGRTGTVRIDDHGRPFRTTSTKGLTRLWYGTNAAGERAWVKSEG
ncbi:helix-turn-helix domain-containing protein [Streptomyces sp. A2-16]|uniref:helix-turn-helix domain-containing protein n=1 Tax=Streptomyces sp. A2-16 TaxID=2781734 RepID=UPI001BB0BC62|nr:helix-turn-helix domain-containing protein [Streptomyces sp. A2-16]QUC57471.1 helix-turn-helix domain-containing protein [Streptomyces sp. A2-16]